MVHHPGGRPMTGLCTVEGGIGSWSSLVASRAARDDERPAMFHVEISSRCAGTKVRLQRLDSTGLYCAVLYCAVLFPAVSECATDRPAPGRPAPHSLLARRVPDGDEDGDGEGNGEALGMEWNVWIRLLLLLLLRLRLLLLLLLLRLLHFCASRRPSYRSPGCFAARRWSLEKAEVLYLPAEAVPTRFTKDVKSPLTKPVKSLFTEHVKSPTTENAKSRFTKIVKSRFHEATRRVEQVRMEATAVRTDGAGCRTEVAPLNRPRHLQYCSLLVLLPQCTVVGDEGMTMTTVTSTRETKSIGSMTSTRTSTQAHAAKHVGRISRHRLSSVKRQLP